MKNIPTANISIAIIALIHVVTKKSPKAPRTYDTPPIL